MIKKHKLPEMIKPKMIKALICGLCAVLTGCGSIGLAQESQFESAYENMEEEPVNIYTSEAPVIVRSVDEANQELTLHMSERNESRTFTYNNVTTVRDKYGSEMTMAQLRAGDIADITYNSELERVGSIILSEDAWSQEGIVKYNLNAGNGSAVIGDASYSLEEDVLVFSDGAPIEISQIVNQDVLTFRGRGHSILSIIVDKGHGYLELIHDEAVQGGWIEVGQTVISQIAPDMLLTVPEGSYTVRLTASGIEESREVTIKRNRETTLNLGDIEIPKTVSGRVTFDVTPQNAQVSVNDTKIDTAYPIRLPTGLHKVTAEASGYDTVSQYFEVDGEEIKVKMELEETKDVSGNSTSGNQTQEASVTIETPADTSVYQDNLYMGIAPVTYTKAAGTHTITLRKTGYITRSYTIEVPDDSRDVTYSFPDLDPESSNTVSGNAAGGSSTVSGNTVESSGSVSGNSVSDNSVSDNHTVN